MVGEESPRAQRVERQRGARRAKLTPVPGTDTSPEAPPAPEGGVAASGSSGPNDDRLRRERPPHW
ncbi:hypothetical protein WDJ51_10120 [Rathayibacter sp. YIM 133350]|uniref:hypothetical protein n=1 Tax=Rathayibacter sp. YIM 133350 TaxID=3131992 RepID=UPI00307E53E3